MTKGEMHTEAVAALGKQDAEKILAMSHSCSHVRYAVGTGYPPERNAVSASAASSGDRPFTLPA
jgi:hypothetical protein